MSKSSLRRKIAVGIIMSIIIILVGGAIAVSASYPNKYYDIISEASQEYSIEHNLVLAIIKTESGFDEKATSTAGAVGLMQIMPATAEWLSDKIPLENYNVSQLTDASINVRLGTYYLKYLLQRFNNNLDLALAAYNAGEGNVASWLSNPQYSDDGLTLKSIPYEETRNYVRKVNRHWQIYNMLIKRNNHSV